MSTSKIICCAPADNSCGDENGCLNIGLSCEECNWGKEITLDPRYFGVVSCEEESDMFGDILEEYESNGIKVGILTDEVKIGDHDDPQSPTENLYTIVPIHKNMDVEILRELIINKRICINRKLRELEEANLPF